MKPLNPRPPLIAYAHPDYPVKPMTSNADWSARGSRLHRQGGLQLPFPRWRGRIPIETYMREHGTSGSRHDTRALSATCGTTAQRAHLDRRGRPLARRRAGAGCPVLLGAISLSEVTVDAPYMGTEGEWDLASG